MGRGTAVKWIHTKRRDRRGLTPPDGPLTTRKDEFPVVFAYSSGKDTFPQIPHCYPGRQAVCAIIEDADAELLERLQDYRRYTGRLGYPPRRLWRAYIAKYVLNLRDSNDLIRRLQDDPGLRAVCGFGDQLPHRTTFNRFR